MSLFAELKRRNVFRVAVTYVVASWLLLQVTDVLVSLLGLPTVAGKFIFLLLVIGFVPALVFSWAYQMTPEGLKRDTGEGDQAASVETARNLDRATIVMLIAVAGLVIFDRFVPEKGSESFSEEQPGSSEQTQAEKDSDPLSASSAPSVAVLPFANMSPDPDNEYFADGIAEELLNLLVDIEGLRVPSRTSSFAFKGRNMDIRTIAEQLQVGHILEGSVRKAGNQVRITAQLIEVSTDTHLWSETYDRELEDIFAIQDEIAGHIVDELKVVLDTGLAERQPTKNLDAYTLFLQGRYLFQQRGESLREAERLLLEAVALDPDFAEAWATLAMVYVTFPNYLGVARAVAYPKAATAARRALSVIPDLADANLAMAQVEYSAGRVIQSIELYEQVTRRQPGHSLAHLWLGIALFQTGYVDEALREISRSLELDPAYGLVLDWYARALLAAGHADESLEPAARAVRLGRDAARVPLMHYFALKNDPEGMQAFLDESDPRIWNFAPRVFELVEHPEKLTEALAWADSLGREWESGAMYARFVFSMFAGDSEGYFERLREVLAYDETVASSVWYPVSRVHRRHPAMKAWARDMHFVELWKSRGWPDLCRPIGDDDFECE